MAELTPQQGDFLAVYLGNGENGTKAAMAVGCSPNNPRAASVTASRWLAKPAMKAAISRAKARDVVSTDKVLKPIVERVRERLATYAEKEHPIEDVTVDQSIKAGAELLRDERAGQQASAGMQAFQINVHLNSDNSVEVE